MKIKYHVAILLILLLITSCGAFTAKSVPEEYKDFIGTWEGNGINLVITKDGGLEYNKISGNGSTSISGPLAEIDNTHFKISVLFIVQNFKVDKRPYVENEKVKMIIDGDILVKKEY